MGCINHTYPPVIRAFLLAAALLIFGCAGEQNAVQKDPFFEKWSTMADTASGNSPAPRGDTSAIARELMNEAGVAATAGMEATVKNLPTQPVSLKMRQADVKTVLRSLARIIDQNIVVKSEIKGEITIDFRNVPWNQAFTSILRTQGLTYIWEGDILRVQTMEDLDLELKRKTQEMGVQWVEPLRTVMIPLDYANPKDLKENLEPLLTLSRENRPRGSVRVDEHSNSLIISAIKDDVVKLISIIAKIDKPTPQIQIKANIVETTKDTARQLGIQWGGMYNPSIGNHDLWVTPGGTGGTTTTNPTAGGYTPTFGSTGLSGQGYAVNFPTSSSAMTTAGGISSLGLMFGTLGGNILEMQLNALQSDSKLNILSSPSITTLNNQKAFTENGERIPIVTPATTTTPATVRYEDAVLRLEITPHVIDNRNLLMKILVKKDEVDTSQSVNGNPFIIKKQTDTTLIVRDGETIVISGLTKKTNSLGTAGVPGLKDVPGLGWLFKSQSRDEKMEEVLIFITPRILPPFKAAAVPTAGIEDISKTTQPPVKPPGQ